MGKKSQTNKKHESKPEQEILSVEESPNAIEATAAETGEEEPLSVYLKYAGILRRGIAYLIDIMIINLFIYWRTTTADGDDMLLKIVPVVFFLIYFPVLEGFFLHATLGKLIMGLKVIDQSGDGVGILRSYSRYFFKVIIGVPTLFLPWLFAGIHPRKQSIHDLISKTFVVTRRKYHQ